eukprot:TRINITY_DN4424_c0_g1_i1.p1 TRINITY_DN4424_c0_g1~~TRINITY_DN4424_c0_g1_i1.p1  ORF type:complete len:573 (-),score=123.23 TRINITY_DN4424_c0_g1_i1:1811-3502(-)
MAAANFVSLVLNANNPLRVPRREGQTIADLVKHAQKASSLQIKRLLTETGECFQEDDFVMEVVHPGERLIPEFEPQGKRLKISPADEAPPIVISPVPLAVAAPPSRPAFAIAPQPIPTIVATSSQPFLTPPVAAVAVTSPQVPTPAQIAQQPATQPVVLTASTKPDDTLRVPLDLGTFDVRGSSASRCLRICNAIELFYTHRKSGYQQVTSCKNSANCLLDIVQYYEDLPLKRKALEVLHMLATNDDLTDSYEAMMDLASERETHIIRAMSKDDTALAIAACNVLDDIACDDRMSSQIGARIVTAVHDSMSRFGTDQQFVLASINTLSDACRQHVIVECNQELLNSISSTIPALKRFQNVFDIAKSAVVWIANIVAFSAARAQGVAQLLFSLGAHEFVMSRMTQFSTDADFLRDALSALHNMCLYNPNVRTSEALAATIQCVTAQKGAINVHEFAFGTAVDLCINNPTLQAQLVQRHQITLLVQHTLNLARTVESVEPSLQAVRLLCEVASQPGVREWYAKDGHKLVAATQKRFAGAVGHGGSLDERVEFLNSALGWDGKQTA